MFILTDNNFLDLFSWDCRLYTVFMCLYVLKIRGFKAKYPIFLETLVDLVTANTQCKGRGVVAFSQS